ncbi:unnamed protein product [Scytosiphon promiscuus]
MRETETEMQHRLPGQHPQHPVSPRYVPGGGERPSFSSPPPSPFSPPAPPPHANGHGRGGGAAPWNAPPPPPQLPPLPHGANRRQVSFQGSRGVTLSFNYWVGRALSNQVLTPDVRQLVTSTLVGDEPAPEFVEGVPVGAKNVVVACVSGLGMMKAELSMAAGDCPFLRSCSSVPVRHSLELPRGRTSTPRVTDVQSGAALMLWGEKPTVPLEEIAAMSLAEVFRDHEVTFTGSKSPGWRDDVSFHPAPSAVEGTPQEGTPGSETPGGEGTTDAEYPVPPSPAQQQQQQQQQQQPPAANDEPKRAKAVSEAKTTTTTTTTTTTLRGNFWRNANRDRGQYTLVVEEEDGAAASAVLTMGWDRWEEEVLVLKERAQTIRFEATDQTLSLTLSCARQLTDEEKKLSHQAQPSSSSGLHVVGVDSSSSSPAAPAPEAPAATPEAAAAAAAAATTEGKAVEAMETGDGPSPASPDKSDSADGFTVVRVPMESLDLEAFSLPSAARYRLGIPLRVSDESPGYVSTDEPMPPSPSRQQAAGNKKGSGGRRDGGAAEGNGENGGLEGDAMDLEEEEEDEEEEGEEDEDDEDDEEEGEIEEEGEVDEEGAIEDGPAEVPRALLPGNAAETPAAAPVVAGTGPGENGGGGGGRGGDMVDAKDKDGDKSDGHRVPVESGEGENITTQRQEDEEREGGKGEFVPPSANKLCPIQSGPLKGRVVLGVDCEMIYTSAGLELARATLVNVRREVVYDELVKPTLPVTDYNTQFSGITADMLSGVSRTLRDAQREILSFVGPETYLVGHSLDSDLKALRLVHRRLIDTSELYPSPRGMPFKNGLRVLSKTVLGRAIQGGDSGHDSSEVRLPSHPCVPVLLGSLRRHDWGPDFELPSAWAAKPNPPKESLFEFLERRGPPGLTRCKVSGDLEARASAEHPPGAPLWSVFNCGYRREQDAVWAAQRFREKNGAEKNRLEETPSSSSKATSNGEESTSSFPSSPSTAVAAAPAAPATAAGAPAPPPESRLGASVTVDVAHFSTAGGMLRDALAWQAPERPTVSTESRSLLWVDMPCDTSDFDNDNGDKQWSSLPEVDRAVSQLYDKMAEGTVLVVVCQGALTPMVDLMAKRTKSKWDASAKEKMDYVAGRKRDHAQISTFDRQDEDELAAAVSEGLNGMCFMASK